MPCVGDSRVASGPGATQSHQTEIIVKVVVRLLRERQAGQGLAEYALILALVGVAAIVAITFMGGSINTMMSNLGNAL